jgi:alkaline phosphatase
MEEDPSMSQRGRATLLVITLSLLGVLAATPLAAARPPVDSVILFIGDGMGAAQIEMARLAGGGEPLAMQRMSYSGVVATQSAGGRTTDSAAAGTALATGHKTENGRIAVAPDGRRLETILERCQKARKGAGLVTTDAVHGATPAAFASHVGDRGMRSEIARQLAESRVQVVLGFGKSQFLPKSAGGDREDGRDLIAHLRRRDYQVAFTAQEMEPLTRVSLLGLFDGAPQRPTLAEMTKAALARLASNADGFFLMVEGASIDWKCHDNDPAGAVQDIQELDEAVRVGVEFARRRGRTLVVVTADHETGGLRIEKPTLVPALGAATACSAEMARRLDEDRGNISAVLAECAGLKDLASADIDQIRQAKDPAEAIAAVVSQRAGVAWGTGGHTAFPVRVFAVGPGAERFTGELDNTDIPKRLAEVLGVGALPK